MKNQTTPTTSAALVDNATMSSIEIAELCNKEPAKVHLDIQRILAEVDIDSRDFASEYKARNGQMYKCYNLPKRECDLVVSGYVAKYRLAIIDRWQELESKTTLPSPTQLALLVIESEKQKEIAQQEVARLQGVCNTITAQFAQGVPAPKFCKQLNGVNTQQVNNSLISMGILLRRKDGIVPSSYARDRYFIERQVEYREKLRSHSELTLTGAKWLYRAYLSNKLPMKKDWDGKFVHVVFSEEGSS